MTQISIRPLKPIDQSQWRELWDGYLDFYQADIDDEVTELTWQRLLDGDGHNCLVAEIDHQERSCDSCQVPEFRRSK